MTSSRSQPLYRYRVTRLGLHFLFVALFAIIGGSLRGFNLLLVLAGLLTSVMLVQWRQGHDAIHRTRLHRRGVPGAFAGTPISIRYDVKNLGRWIPLWSIRIEDRVIIKTCHDTRHQSEPSHDDRPMEVVASVGHIPAGQIRSTSILCRFRYRGHYRIGPVVVSTTFPFCLMSSERLARGSVESIYVYPRLIALHRGWTALLPPRRGGDGNRSAGGTNDDGEFFGLRPWQSGDHVKHIHWRTTARIGEPAVRQFEQRNRHSVCIVVDGVFPEGNGHDSENFERVLELATSLIDELATQTRSVALVVADGLALASPDQADLRHASRSDTSHLFQRLAIAIPSLASTASDDPLAETIAPLSESLRHFDLLLISCRRFQDAVESCRVSQQGERVLSLFRYFDQSGRMSWIDITDRRVQRFLGMAPTPYKPKQFGERVPDAVP